MYLPTTPLRGKLVTDFRGVDLLRKEPLVLFIHQGRGRAEAIMKSAEALLQATGVLHSTAMHMRA